MFLKPLSLSNSELTANAINSYSCTFTNCETRVSAILSLAANLIRDNRFIPPNSNILYGRRFSNSEILGIRKQSDINNLHNRISSHGIDVLNEESILLSCLAALNVASLHFNCFCVNMPYIKYDNSEYVLAYQILSAAMKTKYPLPTLVVKAERDLSGKQLLDLFNVAIDLTCLYRVVRLDSIGYFWIEPELAAGLTTKV